MVENGRINGVNVGQNETLAMMLIESAELVKLGKQDHPVLRRTLEAFLQFMEPPPNNRANATTNAPGVQSFSRMAAVPEDLPSANTTAEQKAATSRKNAERVKADLQGSSEERTKPASFSFPVIPGFTDAAAVKEERKSAPQQAAREETKGTAPREETKGTGPREETKGTVKRVEFQRPSNPKSSLIANGWIEQQRRSKFRTVWKEVLASLVEGRKNGEETTLWIQRQIVNPTTNQSELEALHQIPVKWLEEVIHFDYSADNRFSLKVFNLQEEFIFRCPKDREAAKNWFRVLTVAKEASKKTRRSSNAGPSGNVAPGPRDNMLRSNSVLAGAGASVLSKSHAPHAHYPFDEEEKKSSDVASPQPPPPASSAQKGASDTIRRRTITELRALAHGAGVKTAGLERGELEEIVANILRPTSPKNNEEELMKKQKWEQEQARARVEKEQHDRRVKEELQRRAAAEEDERRRAVAAEEENRRAAVAAATAAEEERRKAVAAEEERRRAAEEERRRAAAAAIEEEKRRVDEERRRAAAAAAEEERRRAAAAAAEEERRRAAEEEKQKLEEERRKAAATEEEEERRRAEEERRKAAAMEEQRQREELERAEEEQKRRQQEEAIAEEHRRRMAERVQIQQEAERKRREEEERLRLEKERREQEEAEHRRRVAEMQERERQEQIRKQQEEYARQQQAWQAQQEEYVRQQRLQQEREARLREEEFRRRQQADQWAQASSQAQTHQQWQAQQQQYQAYYQQQQQQQRPPPPTPPQNAQQQQNHAYYQQQQQQRPPPPTPPQNAQQPQQQRPPSAVNQKYAKMNAESEGAEKNQQIRHGVLVHWALQPPMYQALKPIEALITTIHTVFPPSFGVAGHEHFTKWKPCPFDDISTGPPHNQVDTDKVNKVVRKLRLVLHPDRLPKDLSADQSFLVRLLWDIVSDSFDEHKKKEEDLGWIRG